MAKRRKLKAPMGKQAADTQSLSEKAQLQQQLLFGPELKITKKAATDRDVFEFLNGSKINTQEILKEAKRFIAKAWAEYHPTFPKEYYQQINRLNGWAISDDMLYLKPPIVARFTNDLIYRRFPRFILPTLQHVNPYVAYRLRRYKHFQRLTHEGKELLEKFIRQAVACMKECTTWHEFRVKYAQQYPLPSNGQQSLF